jgi:hypothetical protein
MTPTDQRARITRGAAELATVDAAPEKAEEALFRLTTLPHHGDNAALADVSAP